MFKLRVFAAAGIGWLSIIGLVSGCGGGGAVAVLPGGGGSPIIASSDSTATFHVDVATGQVTVVPGHGPGSRSVFAGSAVKFNSTVLIDQPGAQGIKTLGVSLTNNWGLPIGTDPAGTVNGIRVLFGPFTNVNVFSDARSKTVVSTLVGSGLNGPSSVAVLNGSLYVTDSLDNQIKRVQGGVVSTFAARRPQARWTALVPRPGSITTFASEAFKGSSGLGLGSRWA